MSPRARREDLFNSPEEVKISQLLFDYGVGIDCHSKFIQVCILQKDADNIKRYERAFSTLPEGLDSAKRYILNRLSGLPDLLDSEKRGFRYTIESTGTYHYPVILNFQGVPSVVNPLLASPSRRKTDVLDSRLLAYHAITGLWPPSYFPSETIRMIRVLWALRDTYKREGLRLRNKLQNALQIFGYTFPSHDKTAFIPVVEDMLKTGEIENKAGIAVAGAIQTYVDEVKRMAGQAKVAYKSTLSFIDKQEFITGLGEVILGADLIRLLKTVPGVGDVTAVTWLKEVGDVLRFDNAKAVAAFAGCDPTLKISAGKVTSYSRRGGNQKLHYALLIAAQSVIARKSEPIGIWGDRIQKRHSKGGWKKACGAVARRIAVGLYYVHFKGEKFSYDHYKLNVKYDIPDVPITGLFSPFVERTLIKNGLKRTIQVFSDFDEVRKTKGVGEKCLKELETWLLLNRKVAKES